MDISEIYYYILVMLIILKLLITFIYTRIIQNKNK